MKISHNEVNECGVRFKSWEREMNESPLAESAETYAKNEATP